MKLGHDFCFAFPVHDAHGAVAPDALPTVAVYEDHGAAMAYSPTVAQIGALTGQYFCYGTASAANGFEAGKDYNIVVTALVSGATWNSRIAQFTIEANDIDDVDAVADAVKAVADNIYIDTQRVDDLIEDDGLGSDRFTEKALEQIEPSAQDVIEHNSLDHLLKVAVTGADVVDDSIIARMVSKATPADWDTFVNTTDALEAIRDAITSGTITVADIWAYIVTGLEPAGSSAALLAAAASGGSGDIINQIVIPMSKTRNELLSTTVDVADRIAGHGNIVAASSYVIMFSRDGRVTTSDMIRSVTYNADSVGLVIRRGAYSDSPYKLLIMLWMDSNAWIRVECELVIYRALD